MTRFAVLLVAMSLLALAASPSSAGPCICPQDRTSNGALCGLMASSTRSRDAETISLCLALAERGLDSGVLLDAGPRHAADPRSFGVERERRPTQEAVCGLYEFGCNASGR